MVKHVLASWYAHGSLKEGAALSFYTVLALPALILGFSSIATLFFDRAFIENQIYYYSSFSFGNTGQEVIASMIKQIPHNSTLTLTTFFSILFLILLSSSIFTSLQDSLNSIFHAPPAPVKIKKILQNRVHIFVLVLLLGSILLFNSLLQTYFVAINFTGLHLFVECTNFFLFAVITAILFYFLPAQKQNKKAVLIGSIITTVLFWMGKFLLTTYIGSANFGSAYGAAGSLMALLVWIYYSSQTFYVGAECVAHHSHTTS